MEFENGGFTLKIKMHQVFSVHTTPEELTFKSVNQTLVCDIQIRAIE